MSDPLVEKYSLNCWIAALFNFRSHSLKNVAMKGIRSLIAMRGAEVMRWFDKHGLCPDQNVWRIETGVGFAEKRLRRDG